jgi:hypothetical protein
MWISEAGTILRWVSGAYLIYIYIYFIYCIFTIYSKYLERVISKRDGCEYLKQVPSSDGSLELISWDPLATFWKWEIAEESFTVGTRDMVCTVPTGSALALTLAKESCLKPCPSYKVAQREGETRNKLLMENVSNFLRNSATSMAVGRLEWTQIRSTGAHRYGMQWHETGKLHVVSWGVKCKARDMGSWSFRPHWISSRQFTDNSMRWK